jgi:DNA-directed RNA polymerase subunit M/transcription elongation factor TFIIS
VTLVEFRSDGIQRCPRGGGVLITTDDGTDLLECRRCGRRYDFEVVLYG